ncbi:unnamed protein product [Symbiodinium natans]|uniref:Uncharacterized protein n=1 Tax=Symbiodinium natans TaxID=878477 RepID=A0A812LV44_9DINO|nr:unnamed protein product [Symbiodinium natans]
MNARIPFMKATKPVNRKASSMDARKQLALAAGDMRLAAATNVTELVVVRFAPEKQIKAPFPPILLCASSSSGMLELKKQEPAKGQRCPCHRSGVAGWEGGPLPPFALRCHMVPLSTYRAYIFSTRSSCCRSLRSSSQAVGPSGGIPVAARAERGNRKTHRARLGKSFATFLQNTWLGITIPQAQGNTVAREPFQLRQLLSCRVQSARHELRKERQLCTEAFGI